MPVLTDVLNEDIKKLTGAIDKLVAKVDEETKSSHQFAIDITERLGQINTKMGSIQTTIKIAGGLAVMAIGFAFYASRGMYQTVFMEGKEVGALKAKVDMIDTRFNDHLKNTTQPTSYRVPDPSPSPPPGPGPAPAPETTTPPYVAPLPGDTPSELDAPPKLRTISPPSAPQPGDSKPKNS
jgi:hypothetical protein